MRKLEARSYPPNWLFHNGVPLWILPSYDPKKEGYWLNIRDAPKGGKTVLRRFWKSRGWIVSDYSALHREAKRLLILAGK